MASGYIFAYQPTSSSESNWSVMYGAAVAMMVLSFKEERESQYNVQMTTPASPIESNWAVMYDAAVAMMVLSFQEKRKIYQCSQEDT